MDPNRKLMHMQEVSKAVLSKILSVNPDKKYLILEPDIIKPLEKVCGGVHWLKGNGVEKIFKLDKTCPKFGTYPIFYMIFSKGRVFDEVVTQIRSQMHVSPTGDSEAVVKNKFHVIIVPKITQPFIEELEQLGLLDSAVTLHSFQWLPLWLDTGVLSMELESLIYQNLYLRLDLRFLPCLSDTLWKLFLIVGRPPLILSLGQHSSTILKQIDLMEESRGESDKLISDFGALVMIDRSVDYPSALLTPGTYAALLNEVYGARCGICEYKGEDIDREDGSKNLFPTVKKQPVTLTLDSKLDSVYSVIKNCYFTEVTSILSVLTKKLKAESEIVQSPEMSLDDVKNYIQTKLQATQQRKKFVSSHLLAAESIINNLGPRYESQREVELNILRNQNKSGNLSYLDEIICTEDDKYLCLRLFCLMCCTQKLSPHEIKSFWRKFIHQFGFRYGYTFRYLLNAGFISHELNESRFKSFVPKFTSTKEFYANSSKLKQIPPNPDKINLKFPTCSSYVFGGFYIPLITQIASMLLNSTPIEEIRAKLENLGSLVLLNDGRGFQLQKRSILIYLIGGVTYAEIAACNILEIITGARIVVLSDRVVSGNDLMKDFLS